jgi:hypothetical protein
LKTEKDKSDGVKSPINSETETARIPIVQSAHNMEVEKSVESNNNVQAKVLHI